MNKSTDDFHQKKGDNVIFNELPMGFAMALAKNSSAMSYFSKLNEDMRQGVLNQTQKIRSKVDMQNFVDGLVPQIQG